MGYFSLTGQTLGEYEVLELIGTGGMAQVYRAQRKIGGSQRARIVALKVLNPNYAAQTDYANRFAREIEIAATLEHANIVTIYDWGTQGAISYIVMRLLDGGNLEQRLEFRKNDRHPVPSLGEIASILNPLAVALDFAHGQGIYHRDLKTSNIMFDRHGVPYLVDFGIARVADSTSSLSATGFAMGTAAYMSPELWRGEHANKYTDQYAMGIVIYTLVTGRRPFEGPTPMALMTKHVNDEPTPSHTIRAGIPPAVSDVLSHAMAKDASARFETIGAFAHAFETAIAGHEGGQTGFATFSLPGNASSLRSTTSSSPPIQPPRSEKRSLLPFIAIAALSAIAILVLLALLLTAGDRPPTDGETVLTQPPTSTDDGVTLLTETSTPTPTSPTTETPASTDEPGSTSPQAETPVLTESPPLPIPPTDTPTETSSPTLTPTDVPTATPQPTETSSPTLTPTETHMPTDVPTATPQPTETSSPTVTPTDTPTSIPTPTDTPVVADISFAFGEVSTDKTEVILGITVENPQIISLYELTIYDATTGSVVTSFVVVPANNVVRFPTAGISSGRYRIKLVGLDGEGAIAAQISRIIEIDQPTPVSSSTPPPTSTPPDTATSTHTITPSYTPTPLPTSMPTPLPTVTATLTDCQIVDINGNSSVDVFDIRMISAAVGSTQGDPSFDPVLDLDGDGDVDVFDLRRVASLYGETCP